MKNTIGKSLKPQSEGEGKFSGWQAAAGALASTLGAGNIVGTAVAIALGGPGAVFWLWIAGLAACGIKFCEVTLCMMYRHKNEKGDWVGGPQYYLSEDDKVKVAGVGYAVCMFSSFWLHQLQMDQELNNLVL